MKRWAARTDSENGSDRESIIPPLGEKKGMSATFFSVRAVQHLWQRNSKVSNWQSMKNSLRLGLLFQELRLACPLGLLLAAPHTNTAVLAPCLINTLLAQSVCDTWPL